ncbi:MAG TPA: CopD family protein, partial [Candidatus Binatia bacterium]
MFVFEAATSAISYYTLAVALGCLATAALLMPHGEPTELRVELFSLAIKLLPLFIAASVVSLLFQGAKLNGGQFASLDILYRYLRYTQSGKIWGLRQCYALLLLGGLFGCYRYSTNLAVPRSFLLLLLPLVASRSLTSHAVAVRESTKLAVSADALHLLATAFWAGGLPILFWVLYHGTRKLHMAPSWTAETVKRFSWLAVVAVTLLAITGLYQSWIQVQRLALLFETPYGQVLMLKLLLFLCMIIVGAVNLLSTKPKLFHNVKSQRLPNWLQKKLLRRIG